MSVDACINIAMSRLPVVSLKTQVMTMEPAIAKTTDLLFAYIERCHCHQMTSPKTNP